MNKLEDFGFIQSRPRGEYHANNQQMSKLLHKAIGLGNKGAAPQVGTTSDTYHRLKEGCLCHAVLSTVLSWGALPVSLSSDTLALSALRYRVLPKACAVHHLTGVSAGGVYSLPAALQGEPRLLPAGLPGADPCWECNPPGGS